MRGRRRAEDPPSILQRAVALLARREHSRAELARKLRRYLVDDADPADVDRALEHLEAKGMLSDERFAVALVRSRAERAGVGRIRNELKQHAIVESTAARLLSDLQASEFDRARLLRARKFPVAADNEKERARQMRFLAARGFATDVIVRVMREHGKRP